MTQILNAFLDYNCCAIQKIASTEQRKDGRVQGRLSLCDTLLNVQRRKIFFNQKKREFPIVGGHHSLGATFLVVRDIDCGDWLAQGYMPAHQHCELFYPVANWVFTIHLVQYLCWFFKPRRRRRRRRIPRAQVCHREWNNVRIPGISTIKMAKMWILSGQLPLWLATGAGHGPDGSAEKSIRLTLLIPILVFTTLCPDFQISFKNLNNTLPWFLQHFALIFKFHFKKRAERGCNKPHVSFHPFFF